MEENISRLASSLRATNGIVDVRYVPEDLFYGVVEQKLNRFELAKAYQDKNNYDLLFSGFSMPRTVLRNINGDSLTGSIDICRWMRQKS